MSAALLEDKLCRFLQGKWIGAKRVQGLQGGARALVLALAAAKCQRPMLIIAPSANDAETLHDELAFFLCEDRAMPPLRKRLHLLPSWEALPFERLSPPAEDIAGRLEALYKFVEEPAPVIVSSPAALMQKVIPKDVFKQSYLYLVAGQNLPREALLEHLLHWGFQNVPLVEELGDFSVRGGIVDVCSPGYARPLRLEFNGDVLESVRQFNVSSQRSEATLEDLIILPMKEFSLKRGGLQEILRALDQRAGELEMDRREKHHLIDSLREGIPFPGLEYLAPFFYPELVPIVSYLPANMLVWLDGADRVEAEAERFGQLVWQRCESAKEDRRLVPEARELFLNEHEWRAAFEPFPVVHGESLMVMTASDEARASTLTLESFLTGEIRHEAARPG
ncbi:MAG: hypothetical protein OEN50_05790, partial [Deltaproteobacteria bacterium]|nr:hypothetical protein [Deltaproteobacteria bacterium]